MLRTKYFFLQLAFVVHLTAQIIPDQYIVQLTGEPAIVKSAIGGDHAQVRRAMVSRRVAVRAQQLQVRQAMGSKAIVLDSVELVANALIVESKDPDALRAMPGVANVFPVYQIHPNLDVMSAVHHVPEAWARIGGQGSAGAGMKIGILDSGIDRDHAGFQDDSLATLTGYPKASDDEILPTLSKKLIVGRQYDRLNRVSPNYDIADHMGHGTAVAMVAAGVSNTGPYGLITGFAPKAYLGVYRVFGGENGDRGGGSAIIKAIDDAVSDGMDVINMSLGFNPVSRIDLDVFADAVDRASAAGVIVVVATGNEGPDAFTVSSPAVASSAISAGASYNGRFFSAGVKVDEQTFVGLPGNGPVPPQAVSAELKDAASDNDPTGMLCNAVASGTFQGKVALILRGICPFETKLNNAQSAGAVSGIIYAAPTLPNVFRMDVGTAQLPALAISNVDGFKLKDRIKAGSATATLQFSALAVVQDTKKLADFSSRGPSVDMGIKPDLVAVGTDVSTAAQSKFPAGSVYAKSGYTVIDGTSFSSPAMAGAMAVVKGARPGLTVAQYRSLLVNSTSPMILTDGTFAPVMVAGAGILNLDSAVATNTVLSPVSVTFGVGDRNPDRSREIQITNLGKDADTFSIAVASTDAMSAVVDPATVQIPAGESRKVNLSFRGKNIANGEYQGFVTVKGINSPVESRMAYWYAAPTYVPTKVKLLTQFLPISGRVNSSQTLDFVLLDATGVPITTETPKITVVSGDGRVGDLKSYDPFNPGLWEVSVILGPAAGPNVFHIESGDAKRDVTISGQ